MFSTQSDKCIPICPFFGIISLYAAEFEKPKIGISGKGLTPYHTILSFNYPETARDLFMRKGENSS